MGEELVVRFKAGAARQDGEDATVSIGMDILGGQLAYVSHAHSDHSSAVGGPLPIFCSDETATLLGLGVAKEMTSAPEGAEAPGMAADEKLLPLPASAVKDMPLFARRRRSRKSGEGGGRIGVPEGIVLHPAGHILGATQLAGESPTHGRLVYTGDFKLRDGLTVKGASVVECDTLIAECTYGDPAVAFPAPEEVYADMERWSRQNRESIQLWGGYSTGKAQEIVKFLNDYMDIEPVVSGRLAQVCAHYATHGVKLRWLDAEGEEAQEAMRGPFCAVLPPHILTPQLAGRIGSAHRRKALTALATGWAQVRPLACSVAFAMSDHADYGQLLEYAAGCGAKTIYLAHGDNEKTARALRQAGYNALPIEQRLGRQLALEIR